MIWPRNPRQPLFQGQMGCVTDGITEFCHISHFFCGFVAELL